MYVFVIKYAKKSQEYIHETVDYPGWKGSYSWEIGNICTPNHMEIMGNALRHPTPLHVTIVCALRALNGCDEP